MTTYRLTTIARLFYFFVVAVLAALIVVTFMLMVYKAFQMIRLDALVSYQLSIIIYALILWWVLKTPIQVTLNEDASMISFIGIFKRTHFRVADITKIYKRKRSTFTGMPYVHDTLIISTDTSSVALSFLLYRKEEFINKLYEMNNRIMIDTDQ